MRHIYKLPLLLIAALLVSNCAGTYQQRSTMFPEKNLARQIDRQIAYPELETALVGIMVQSVKTGEILYQHNANTLMMPASNEKIPTSAAALVRLGPDFRYQTPVYIAGKIEDGILKGDLIIVASGDPTFSSRFCENKTDCYIFQAWADSLRAKGINAIEGDIIGIDDVFDDESIGYGWSLNNLSYSYSTQIGGFMYNENMARVIIMADSSGEYMNIKIIPDLGYLKIEPALVINHDETEISVDRIPETNTIQITGKIRPGDRHIENVSIHDPTIYFLSALKWELVLLGIPVYGQPIDADVLTTKEKFSQNKLLFTQNSVLFKDVLKILMKESQNLYAESLVKLLGYRFGKEGSFEEGAKIVKQTLRRFGLEEDSYSFMDGSGLCRYNYISPAHLVKILRNMYYHRYSEIYRQSLPIAGVDGTIDYRMKGTAAQNNIFAKTGTISNVRCLSGYAITKDSETLVFSTMFNNFLCSVNVMMDVQDQICMLLSSFSRNR
jgi:D-alanyl-D-alanine carboxypeptidase/D-alanyl-D-alanine-endopeptidase (penicillin-binding protein 4)